MQKKPREHNDKHLQFIRQLPCLICADNISTEAAHVRYADRSVDKPMTGIGIKPDDKYTIPLCGHHHRAQHSHGNEREWWKMLDCDPVKIALALHSISGDHEKGLRIVAGNQ